MAKSVIAWGQLFDADTNELVGSAEITLPKLKKIAKSYIRFGMNIRVFFNGQEVAI